MASQGETTSNDKNRTRISYLTKDEKEIPCIPNAPFELLHKYKSQAKRFRQGQIIRPMPETTLNEASHSQELSAESIVKIAKMRLQTHNPDSVYPCDVSPDDLRSIELVSSLLEAAGKFSQREFDRAVKLLEKCSLTASAADNPVERVVRFFAEALRQRVDIERGKIDLEKRIFPLEERAFHYQPVILACEQKLPSSQVTQFTAIQVILDRVGSAKRIHLVDFSIKTGLHWSIMMEGLANRAVGPIHLLKITAIGASKERLEETGKRLSSFAESMKLPFLFKSVVSEMNEDGLDPDSVCIEPNEVVAVYLGLNLWARLAFPNQLRSFVQFVKKLHPCVIVANEIEANTNSPVFVDRFHEALAFSMTMFDYLDACLEGETRKIIEEVFFQDMILNIITAEDEERTHRHAKVGFWRKFFEEFRIVETEFSESCVYQASLLIKRNDKWKSATLHMDGKSIIVGWKGTPMQSISAWKICDDEFDFESIQVIRQK